VTIHGTLMPNCLIPYLQNPTVFLLTESVEITKRPAPLPPRIQENRENDLLLIQRWCVFLLDSDFSPDRIVVGRNEVRLKDGPDQNETMKGDGLNAHFASLFYLE
jgi:glutathione S-transferase